MSKPTKVGNRWRARVRKNGQQRSKYFSTRRDAELWIKQTEIEIETGSLPPKTIEQIRVSQVINRFIADELPKRKAGKRDTTILKKALRDYPNLFGKPINKFGRLDVVHWKEDRLKKVQAASVLREWTSLSSCFTHAIKVWGLPIKNPFSEVKRPAKPPPRYRRVSADEIKTVLDALQWSEDITERRHYVAWAFLFALETACRIGEICKLEWSDIQDVGAGKIACLRDTKNGSDRNVPLNAEARRLLSLLPKDDKKLIPITQPQADGLFRKHRPDAVRDLHFHDSRHEALTRMAKIVINPMDLAKISGHKDVNILMTVYYNPDNHDLVELFD